MKKKKDNSTKQLAIGTMGPYLNGGDSRVLKGPPPDEIYDALEAVKLETEVLLKRLTRRTKPPVLIQAHNTYSWQKYRIGVRAGFVRSDELEQAGALKAEKGLAFRFQREVVESVSNKRVFEYGLVYAAEKPDLVTLVEHLCHGDFIPNEDFSCIRVKGTDYFLTPNQARLVEYLSEQRRYGLGWVKKNTLLQILKGEEDPETPSMDKLHRVFQHNKSAYKALIENDGKGRYRLKYD